MSRREFYAWVAQADREANGEQADDPGSWSGTDQDEWWQEARRKRAEQLGRR